MAGTQNIGEAADNPVAINVTAMVDVIFCLCLFFMCSLHFKQLEGKIDAWLPKHGRDEGTPPPVVNLEEIRIALRWDAAAGAVERRIGSRPPAATDGDLMGVVRDMAAGYRRAGRHEAPVIIDSESAVPWVDVLHVLDLCKLERMDKIEFTAPAM